MKSNNHVEEELLIDFVRSQLDENKKEEIQAHINRCERCAANVKEWQLLLKPDDELDVAASPYVKARIDRSIEQLSEPKITKSKKPIFAFISGVAVILLCIGLYANIRTQDLTYEVRQNEEIEEASLVLQPDTNRLDIIPVANDQDISGNVWINDATNEMLVEVQGLTHLTTNDYQLWVIHTNDRYRSELLKLENGMARVYYRGEDVAGLKLIKASVEPLGGSEQPTGPETFYVDFTSN